MSLIKRMAPVRALAVAAVLVAALNSCYMPARFDAEIQITRTGFYSIIFDGYMVSIPLYEGIRKKEINKEEEKKKVEVIKTDLTRDSSTKEFQYFKKGYFKVHWEKEGDLLGTRMVAFFRRNQNFLSLKFVKRTRLITMQGASIKKMDAERLAAIGLGMQGQLRVKTDAKVIQHNATRIVDKPPQKIYVWDIVNPLPPTPKLLIEVR